MKKLSSLALGLLVAIGVANFCLYTEGERESALVFALGE